MQNKLYCHRDITHQTIRHVMKERYINPYTDFGFKRLFGTEMNKELLISFLNSVLTGEKGPISDVRYLNSEHLGDGYGDRRGVFDV